MNHPFVSVIIPNYNHALYLDQRIQSVLGQTYSNFEVIILDDKSTDNSVEVIEKYKNNKLIRHIVINDLNSGSTFIQWNKGFELANGDIIWIAESDDYCEPNFLHLLVNAYTSNLGTAVVYSSSQYVDSKGKFLETPEDSEYPIHCYEGKEFIRHKMVYGSAIWNASSAIFSKRTALSINRQYQDFKACGDRLFWIKMAEKGNVIHLNQRLNYFRQHLNKVSPKRFRDGTSLKEEYLIFQQLCSKKYLYGWRRVFVLSLYYNKIKYGEFEGEKNRCELLRLWKFDNTNRVLYIKLLSRLYAYYCRYIARVKPI